MHSVRAEDGRTQFVIAGLFALAGALAASYVVHLPLPGSGAENALGWLWPDSGERWTRVVGILVSTASAGLLSLSGLAVLVLDAPIGWRRAIAIAGSALSFGLMVLLFSPMKLFPIAIDIALVWLVVSDRFEGHR
jgi:hypothetical protein